MLFYITISLSKLLVSEIVEEIERKWIHSVGKSSEPRSKSKVTHFYVLFEIFVFRAISLHSVTFWVTTRKVPVCPNQYLLLCTVYT